MALKIPRSLFGTNSPRTTEKDNCPAAARPLMQLVAISISMLCALAPMMLPTIASKLAPVKNHRRPKMSERRPTQRNPTAKPASQDTASQMEFELGPMAALMREMVLAGRTQPRYPEI